MKRQPLHTAIRLAACQLLLVGAAMPAHGQLYPRVPLPTKAEMALPPPASKANTAHRANTVLRANTVQPNRGTSITYRRRNWSGSSSSSSKRYISGPRGGCYYLNGNGNKSYVDRSLC